MRITPNVPTGAFTLNAWATWDVLFDDNDKAIALFSSKSKLSQLAMAAPEMLELLAEIRDQYLIPRCGLDDCTDCDDKIFAGRIDALMEKIEGGEA